MTVLTSFGRERARWFAPISFALFIPMLAAPGGCGDAGESQVTLEVEAPATEQGMAITSLDYEIACDAEWITLDESGAFVPATLRRGTMELTGPVPTSSDDQVDRRLWSAAEAPLSGLCLLNLVGRDQQQQALCAGTATFEAAGAVSERVRAVMDCLDPPAFIGDLFVGAETPRVVGQLELETVEFTIGCDARGTAFFDGMSDAKAAVNLNGNLEVVEESGRRNVRQSFLDLPAGSCTVQLRARDEDGEVRCTGDESFIIAPVQTTNVTMVVRCDA